MKDSTLGGQGKKTGSTSTGLTGAQAGLTGSQTGLTSVSHRSDRCPQKVQRCPESKKKVRPSFEELLAKYKRKGVAQKQKDQPKGAKGVKIPPRHKRQEGLHNQQGNFASAQYLFVGSVMPFSWYYPCYYSPADYSSMYMKPYMITYPNCDRPVVSSNNLVRSDVCTTNKPGKDNNKQNSKDMQPRWCPSGLSHTQKRRLQRLRKRG